jgi:hypothetical protein
MTMSPWTYVTFLFILLALINAQFGGRRRLTTALVLAGIASAQVWLTALNVTDDPFRLVSTALQQGVWPLWGLFLGFVITAPLNHGRSGVAAALVGALAALALTYEGNQLVSQLLRHFVLNDAWWPPLLVAAKQLALLLGLGVALALATPRRGRSAAVGWITVLWAYPLAYAWLYAWLAALDPSAGSGDVTILASQLGYAAANCVLTGLALYGFRRRSFALWSLMTLLAPPLLLAPLAANG